MSEDRTGPGLKLGFDSLDEAVAEFDKQKAGKLYRSGIIYEWHKISSEWVLVDRFPSHL